MSSITSVENENVFAFFPTKEFLKEVENTFLIAKNQNGFVVLGTCKAAPMCTIADSAKLHTLKKPISAYAGTCFSSLYDKKVKN